MFLFRVSWILIWIQSPTDINSTDKQLLHDNETTRNTAHWILTKNWTILRRHEIDENRKEGDGKGEQKRGDNRTQIPVTFYIYTLNSHFQIVQRHKTRQTKPEVKSVSGW